MNYRLLLFILSAIYSVGCIKAQDPDGSLSPASPKIIAWSDFNPTLGYGVVQFQIPLVSVSGNTLSADNVSYRLLVNSIPYIYKVVNNPLPGNLMSTEWIPVNYEDYDIKIEDGYHYLFFVIEGTNNLALQSRYVDSAGTEWLSEIVDNGIEGVLEISDENVVRVESYDMIGRIVSEDVRGPVIERLFRADGSVSSRKIVR